MSLKIEFEMSDQDSVELIRQLKNIVASSPTPVISKLLAEVEKDVKVPIDIGLRFMMHVKSYTNEQVDMEKRFIEDLGFASWWIGSDNGLAAVCNLSLDDIVNLYGGNYKTIKATDVKSKKKVTDVVDVLVQKYKV